MLYDPNRDPAGLPATSYIGAAGAPIGAPPLEGEVQADVAVIGGGITGCSLALHAAEAGARVVLLEANAIGWGASGRSSGHLPAASKLEPDLMIAQYGDEAGARMMDALAGGPDVVFALADRLAGGAGAERSGTIVAAHAARVLPRLARRTRYWQGRGAAVEFLEARGAEAATGSRHYVGAYRDRRGGTINPLAYVRGLARGAAAAGAAVHEGSRALRLTRQANGWHVATAKGSVRAASVVLCTNGHTDDLWPRLRQSVIPARLYQYVTVPLAPEHRVRILPERPGMTDTYRVLSGVRVFADGRLQINGRGPRFGAAGEGGWRAARARLATIWPELAGIALDEWWTGWVAMNREDGWKVHELAPGVLAALGCNGRGVVIGTLIGRDLAAHLGGTPVREMLFPFVPLRPIPLHAVHRPIARGIVAWRAFRDRIDQRI